MVPRPGGGRCGGVRRHGGHRNVRGVAGCGADVVRRLPERHGARRPPRGAAFHLRQPRLRRHERRLHPGAGPCRGVAADVRRDVHARLAQGDVRLHVRRGALDDGRLQGLRRGRHPGGRDVDCAEWRDHRFLQAVLLPPARAAEEHVPRAVALGTRRRTHHDGAFVLPQRHRDHGTLPCVDQRRPLHLAGRVHRDQRGVAQVHRPRIRRPPPRRARERRDHREQLRPHHVEDRAGRRTPGPDRPRL